MEEQIARDVPRTSYCIGLSSFGCAMGEQMEKNIEQKKVSASAGVTRVVPGFLEVF